MDNKEKNTFLDRYKSKITKNKTENISRQLLTRSSRKNPLR